MRRAAACAAVLACGGLAAAPVAAEPMRSHLVEDGRGALLYPGERMTVRVAADGALTLVSVVPAPAGSAQPPKPGPKPPEAAGDWITADRGEVALMIGREGDATLLKVESGLDQAFDYRAVTLQPRLDPRPAPVCTVLPLLASYERWERPAAAVRLDAFAPRATNEVVCPDPSDSKSATR